MSTFDLSFDETFRPLTYDPVAPTQSGCRREAIYLTWLTLQGGWMYWPFEGNVLRGQSPTSRGDARQGGLTNYTQKETAQTMVLHTANLTEAEANAVGTIRESISVYWLKHNEDDTIEQIRVTVPVGDADLWDSQNYTNNFTIQIVLPSRRSQRL